MKYLGAYLFSVQVLISICISIWQSPDKKNMSEFVLGRLDSQV